MSEQTVTPPEETPEETQPPAEQPPDAPADPDNLKRASQIRKRVRDAMRN